MNRLVNIKTSEAKALLRLANELHAAQDPSSRKRRLIEGLCGLIRGSAGLCTVRHLDLVTRKTTIVSSTEYRSASIHELIPAGKLSAADADESPGLPSPFDEAHALVSTLQLPSSTVSATLRLVGLPAGDTRFTRRHQQLVDLFHAEMTWLYQTDVLLTSPSALALSRRARQTLEHLLEGLSEKQIASKLNLSQNTVHHYVKSIHKHFDVSSRSELLARWVAK